MLPEMFAEQQLRVYFRKNDPQCLEKAKRLVQCSVGGIAGCYHGFRTKYVGEKRGKGHWGA